MPKNAKLDPAAEKHVQRMIDAYKDPAFEGTLEFDLAVDLLGERFTRRARIVYTYTPGDWAWFDLTAGKERRGTESASYHMEVAAVREYEHDDGTVTYGKPRWVRCMDILQDDVPTNAVLGLIINSIDLRCRSEDAERRKAAGLK
jgi:hypothetical protein